MSSRRDHSGYHNHEESANLIRKRHFQKRPRKIVVINSPRNLKISQFDNKKQRKMDNISILSRIDGTRLETEGSFNLSGSEAGNLSSTRFGLQDVSATNCLVSHTYIYYTVVRMFSQ